MVNYYRDMWPRWTHVLAPLTNLIGKKKFQWNKEQDEAFKQMKALIATDALLAYLDHNKPFKIEMDSSDYQLGGVIKQNGRPVAYNSRKLIGAEKNYTTIEKECLAIVEILKHFRTVLLGARITVFMDHKNLTHEMTKFATQHVLQWCLQLEEYGAKFCYKKGEENVVADALSQGSCQPEGVLTKPTNMADAQWSILDEPALAECLSKY